MSGGNYDQQIRELYDAVSNNRELKSIYDEISRADDDLCTEEILEILLAEYGSIKADFTGDEIIYWDGKWSH